MNTRRTGSVDHVIRLDILKRIMPALVDELLAADHVELPKYRYDGSEITTAEEAASILGIPVIEASHRMARAGIPATRAGAKDVYTGAGSIPATRRKKRPIYERACALAYMRERKEEDK